MLNYLFFLIIAFVTTDYLFGAILGWLNRRAAKPQLPPQLDGIYDGNEYARQQQYFKENNRFSSVVRTFEYALMMAMLFTGGFGILDGFAYTVTPSPVLAALFFFAVLYIGNDVLTLPFSYYDTFVIEERFGFNRMTRRLFFEDKFKSWLIASLLGGALLATVYILYQRWSEMFWLYSWVIICAIVVFLTMFYSEWIVPIFNKQTLLEPGPLQRAIKEFASKADFEISNIYVMDGSKRSSKANAYFSGLGKRKRVVLYDTLIKELTIEEIVAVLAHEIGHYKYRHTFLGLGISLLNSFILLYVFSLLVDNEVLAHAMGGKFPTFELGLIAFTLLYSPIELVTGILMNVLSRHNEFQADRYAASFGMAESLISALRKISVKALSNLTPSPVYVFVYYSHPTLLQRVKRLQAYQRNSAKN
ncbi:MAG: M48 family metallopeptidase [Bacteroidales bacterium]